MLKPLILAALAAAGARAASAELVLEGVHWQVGRVERGRVAAWVDVRVLEDGPPALDSRVRARLVVKNRGPRVEEGLLIRYSLTARLAPAEAGSAEGSWVVPFAVEEKRVPKVGPNKIVEVPLDSGAPLKAYLRRLSRAGWWPAQIRLQAMLEPRAGTTILQTVEDVLDVRREAKP